MPRPAAIRALRLLRGVCLAAVLAAAAAAGQAAPPAAGGAFGLQPHEDNYVLLYSRMADTPPGSRDRDEVKFQFSLKREVLGFQVGCGAACLWVLDAPLYLAYTQRSFWQAYDAGRSRPFRETLYNPGLFLDYGESLLAGTPYLLRAGLEHLSNGQALPRSRSWNRVFVQAGYEDPAGEIVLKAWQRIPERAKSSPDDPTGDDNPDITDYFGYAEARLRARLGTNHEMGLLLRPGSRTDTLTGQLDYFYHPANYQPGVYLHVQFFNGYGESLIDYDRRVRRIGLGLAFR